jgi:diacylglycerol kinase family enzyme
MIQLMTNGDHTRPGDVLCVLNDAAGLHGGASRRHELEEIFARYNRKVVIVSPRPDLDIARLVQSAVGRKDRLVLAGGGDGTMNAVAGVLAGTETALGVLPLGTLNHFAKDLQIPLQLEDAVATAFGGEIARVDMGEVNGRYFLNNSSIGIYPGIVREREVLQRQGQSKPAAFLEALIFSLWRFRMLSVRLHVDGAQESATPTPFVFVGNNRYEVAAPEAGKRRSLQEGTLWICQAPHAGRARLLIWALYALLGGKRALETHVVEAHTLSIEARRTHLSVSRDGEVTQMSVPLNYAIRPLALRVVVPAVAGRSPQG